jgi:hypothetical protein
VVRTRIERNWRYVQAIVNGIDDGVVVLDPNDPKFDLEKVLDYASKHA